MRGSVFQIFCVVCWVWVSGVYGEVVPKVDAPSAVQEWLTDLKVRWEQLYKERVVDVYLAGLQQARQEYEAQVGSGLEDAVRVRDQQAGIVFRRELEQLREVSWRMPMDDRDTSSVYLRKARGFYRSRVVELEKEWEESVRKLRTEFDGAMGQAVQQLAGRRMEEEARRVHASRQELATVWLSRMREVYHDVRLSRIGADGQVADGASAKLDGSSAKADGSSGASKVWDSSSGNRKAVEAAVKWALESKAVLTIRKSNGVHTVEKASDLPGGKVDFVSFYLDRGNFGRGLFPDELRQLAALRGLEFLTLGGFDLSGDLLSFLDGAHEVQHLTLRRSKLDMQSARWITRRTGLRHLEMSTCEGLNADFFRELKGGLSDLRALWLTSSMVGDEAGAALVGFEKLEMLRVDKTDLTPAVFPTWRGFRNLKRLCLFGGPWDRAGLEHLSRLPLEYMDGVTSSPAEFASQITLLSEFFPKLKGLGLAADHKGEMDVEHAEWLVEHFKDLETLHLGIKPSLEAAKVLLKLHRLHILSARVRELDDEVFQELLKIRSLKDVDVVGSSVSDRSMDAIQRAAAGGLRVLRIFDARFSESAASNLRRRCMTLTVYTKPAEP